MRVKGWKDDVIYWPAARRVMALCFGISVVATALTRQPILIIVVAVAGILLGQINNGTRPRRRLPVARGFKVSFPTQEVYEEQTIDGASLKQFILFSIGAILGSAAGAITQYINLSWR